MKKLLLSLLGLTLFSPLAAKTVPQRITVLLRGSSPETRLYQESLEARLMEAGSPLLLHADRITADPNDPARFLAVTGLDGLVTGEVTPQGLRFEIYARKGLLWQVDLPAGTGVERFDQAAVLVSGQTRLLFPEQEQRVVVKVQEVQKSVSPLSFYRPRLAAGLRLDYLSQSMDLYFVDTNVQRFLADNHPSPALLLSLDYRLLSLGAEFQYYSGEQQTPDQAPIQFFRLNPALRAELRLGVWLVQGFLNLNLGLEYDRFHYQVQISNLNDEVFEVLRLVPQVRLRFTDTFMLGLSAVGFNLLPKRDPALHVNSSPPRFQFLFTWDFQIRENWRVQVSTLMFNTPYNHFHTLEGQNVIVNIDRTAMGVAVLYQWDLGGKQ